MPVTVSTIVVAAEAAGLTTGSAEGTTGMMTASAADMVEAATALMTAADMAAAAAVIATMTVVVEVEIGAGTMRTGAIRFFVPHSRPFQKDVYS